MIILCILSQSLCAPRRNQPIAETYLPILLGAGNKSTNDLATFAVRRTWRLRSSDVTYRHCDSPARCRHDPVLDEITERLSRIGQILQPRSQRESSTCADRLFLRLVPIKVLRSLFLARSTVVVDTANLCCYLRFNYDARLVNKRAASTAHRRSGK